MVLGTALHAKDKKGTGQSPYILMEETVKKQILCTTINTHWARSKNSI